MMSSANHKLTGSGGDSTPGGTTVSALLLQVSLARATALARAGHFVEAESFLSGTAHGREQSTPAALDLLARIRAQQGRMLEAAAYWNQALKLDEANGAYQDGLNRIARMKRRPPWLRRALFFMGILAIISSFVVGAVMLGRYGRDQRASSKSETVGVSDGRQGLKAGAEEPKPQESLAQPPNIKLAISGASQKAEYNQSVVTFDSGLFRRGTSLKREANNMLATLSQQLRPFAGKVKVEVIGCTDDVPVPRGSLYKDNASLALGRAVTVIERLRASGLPAEMLLAGRGAESFAPYPNNSRQNRSKNQTVVLRISNNNR